MFEQIHTVRANFSLYLIQLTKQHETAIPLAPNLNFSVPFGSSLNSLGLGPFFILRQAKKKFSPKILGNPAQIEPQAKIKYFRNISIIFHNFL